MFIILGVSFASLYLCFYKQNEKRIEIWMKTTIIWCVLLFAKTEIMSLFGGISSVSCFLFWLGVSLSAIVTAVYKGNLRKLKKEMTIFNVSWLKYGGGGYFAAPGSCDGPI